MKTIFFKNSLLVLIFALSSYGCQIKNAKNSVESLAYQQKNKVEVKKAEVFVTAKNTNQRLTQAPDLVFEKFAQPDEHFPTVIVDPAKTFQTIEGFGGALTDAAAETIYKLSKKNQQKIFTAYFDKEKGIAYNLFRTHINSCDFSSESYAYAEVEGDINLEHFSIAKDRTYRIPLIKEAINDVGNDFRLLISPWSPPAWMKTNNHMLQGGKLKPEYYQTWANYFVRFIQEYKKEGIPVWALTVQNEPMAVQTWESCIYTAEEERDFVKNFLGPTLWKNNFNQVKVLIWDHNRGLMYQRAKVALDDPEASKYIWGTGFHWYTGNHFQNVAQVQEAFPDKHTLFTEGCVFPFNYKKLEEWQWGERYGESIIQDLNHSATGWIDWNIVLDETGGPNHVANFCYAPIIGNTKTDEVIFMNSYYYLGHFSKFIDPGAKRIIASSNCDDLMATAAINPNGKIVVVVMNRMEKSTDYKIWIEGKAITANLPEHAITTLVIE